MRRLARRSASAAREIKRLISASLARVDSGARWVHGTGSTVGEISRSAQAQSRGIGRVNPTVTPLDGTTQQNAALVAQSAAA